MEQINIAKTETIAFYSNDDFTNFISKKTKDETVVGFDVSIERVEIEDPRSNGSVTVYTVTTFHDLAK